MKNYALYLEKNVFKNYNITQDLYNNTLLCINYIQLFFIFLNIYYRIVHFLKNFYINILCLKIQIKIIK